MLFIIWQEWLDYSGALKTQIITLSAVLAQKLPVVCVGFLQKRASILLSMPLSAYLVDQNDADDVRKWQSFGSFFEILSIELLLPVTESSLSGVHCLDGNTLVSGLSILINCFILVVSHFSRAISPTLNPAITP